MVAGAAAMFADFSVLLVVISFGIFRNFWGVGVSGLLCPDNDLDTAINLLFVDGSRCGRNEP